MTVSSSVSRLPRCLEPSTGKAHVRLAAVLRHALRRRLPVSLPRPIGRQGGRSIAFQARHGARHVVIKLTRRRNSFPVEAWVYRALRQAGVPVPEVCAVLTTLPGLGLPCLVTSMVAGEPLFAHVPEAGAGQRLYAGMGELLARIHAVALPRVRFGLGAFLPGRHGACHGSWRAFIEHYHAHPHAAHYLLARGLLAGTTRADIDALGEAVAAHRFGAVLNHGDFGPDHILVHEGRIAGIIDPGEAFAGPAEYDLGYLASYLGARQFDLVLRGYASRVDRDKVGLYTTIVALHKAARAAHEGHTERARRFAAIACAAWPRAGARPL